MLYLYSKYLCSVFTNLKIIELQPNIMYEINDLKNEDCILFGDGCFPVVVNFFDILNSNKSHANIQKVQLEKDVILFVNLVYHVFCNL